MKVLFVTPVPLEGAGTRARIIQYLPYLAAAGIRGDVRPFFSAEFFAIVYQSGRWATKLRHFFISSVKRFSDCLRAKQYDVVYLYREGFPLGPPVIEWWLLRSGKPVVYDLDDAIHLPDPRPGLNRRLISLLKWHSKVPWMIARSAHVVVGNDYLKAYAERFNPRVTVVPTPEDPSRFPNRPKPPGTPFTIGWIGSHSTAHYLKQLTPVFQELAKRYSFVLKVVGANSPIVMPGVQVVNKPWRLHEEVEDVQSFDIGAYPLSGAEFDRGKACYKAILYMAAGVPIVASNHGANRDIIQDGVNGLLASSEREWIERLALSIENPTLRARLAEQGRQTVAARYSVAANAAVLTRILKTVHPMSDGASG